MKSKFPCWCGLALAIGLLLSLASCSSGSDSVAAPPIAEIGALQEVGKPFDAKTVLAIECAKPLDLAKDAVAALARYPQASGMLRGWPSFGSQSPADYRLALQL